MFRVFEELYKILTPKERAKALVVFVLMLGTAAVEVLGVASIMPFIAVLANPEIIDTNQYLNALYDAVGSPGHQAFLFWLGIAVFALLVGSLVIKAFSAWAQLRFSYMRNCMWAARLVSGYLRQPYEWYLNKHSAELATSVLSEATQVVYEALMPALHFVAQAMVVLLITALLFVVDPLLAMLCALVLIGAYVLIYFFFRGRLEQYGKEWRQANRDRFRLFQDALGGIKEVKLLGLEGRLIGGFERISQYLATRQVAANLISQVPSLAMQGLVFGGMLLLLLYLINSYGGLQQALPIVSLYAFAGYRLMPALQTAYQQVTKMRVAGPMLAALRGDLEAVVGTARVAEHTEQGTGKVLALGEALELDRVTYRYPGAERTALDDVSIEIPARSIVGIVGSTGSGKTTLVDILLGLLRPTAGEVVVDGQPVTTDRLREWQRLVGYVPQQIFLSDDTISANIAFGVHAAEIDQSAVAQSAKVACLDSFIVEELPGGYQARIGERGVRLSGGQRQRIGIARALYHDPQVLILDEATSALDNVTERAVMRAMQEVGQKKTVIIIAHRLSTVRNCDKIFVLDAGRVVAAGTYDELLDSSPHFKRLVQSQ